MEFFALFLLYITPDLMTFLGFIPLFILSICHPELAYLLVIWMIFGYCRLAHRIKSGKFAKRPQQRFRLTK